MSANISMIATLVTHYNFYWGLIAPYYFNYQLVYRPLLGIILQQVSLPVDFVSWDEEMAKDGGEDQLAWDTFRDPDKVTALLTPGLCKQYLP